jgi:hypothetical protein
MLIDNRCSRCLEKGSAVDCEQEGTSAFFWDDVIVTLTPIYPQTVNNINKWNQVQEELAHHTDGAAALVTYSLLCFDSSGDVDQFLRVLQTNFRLLGLQV